MAHWPQGMTDAPEPLSRESGHPIDVMATCLDERGAKYPVEFGGEKITPLEGRRLLKPHRPQVLSWEHERNWAVRNDKWKLVSRYPGELKVVRSGGRPDGTARFERVQCGQGDEDGGAVRDLGEGVKCGALGGAAVCSCSGHPRTGCPNGDPIRSSQRDAFR